MFIGEYQHNVDQKGRMFVPAKFREELGESFFATVGLDNCLFVFPADEFMGLKAKVDALSIANRDARQFARFFFAGATECEIDKQGRILLPAKLREYAHLTKDVTVVGVSNRVEIWDSEKWAAGYDYAGFDPDELSAKMEALGL